MDRQNAAYDLSMYESLLEQRPEKKQPEAKPVKTVKFKSKLAFKNVVYVLSLAVMLSLCVGVIYTKALITETTNSIARTQNAITEAESAKAYLEFTLESRMSLNEVEDYAVGVLGMVKMDSSQVEYVEIENENNVEWAGNELGDRIEEAVQPILSYFEK